MSVVATVGRTRTQACIPGAQRLLAASRAAGMSIVHTLEAHKPDLSDLHPAKLNRGHPPAGMRIGDKSGMGRILVRNEPGNGIVDEVAPKEVCRLRTAFVPSTSTASNS